MYLERHSKEGMWDNPLWYDTKINAGAFHGYKVINGKNTWCDYRLGNCTTFVQGEATEILEKLEAIAVACTTKGGFGNAKTWFDNSPLPKSKTTPKYPCICVWGSDDATYGHVAIALRGTKEESGYRNQIIQSNYVDDKSYTNKNYFQEVYYTMETGVVTKGVGIKFIGYLYLSPNDKRIERDTTKHQVQITADRLKARKEAGLSGEWYEGRYIPMCDENQYYNVLDTKETDGYTWVKLDDNCWCALVEDCYTDYIANESSVDFETLYYEAKAKLDKISEMCRS